MNETVVIEPAVPGVFSRAIGIITSPKATFELIVRSPRTIGILALIAILFAASQSAFSMTEKGRQATVDFQVQQMEKMGMTVTDEMYAALEKRSPFAVYQSIISAFIFMPIGALVSAGILYALFNAIMGGTAEFKQVLAVVSHAWIPATLGAVFNGIMSFVRGSIATSSANIGLLLPMLREGSFAANLAGGIDLFSLWWLVVLSMGLGVLYKRKTSSIATGLFIVYAIIVACFSFYFRKG